MVLQKKDFIEIEFTGKIKDGGVFDSNVKENLEKLGSTEKPKPFIFCLGEGMFLKGVDDFLIGKEIGAYNIELAPENAFGPREGSLIQTIPSRIFKEQNLNPMPGAVFNFDGRLAKILSVSGGRIMVDFNHPLAGKILIYDIKVLKKIEDLNEKIKSYFDFLFKRDFKFTIDGKKVTIEAEKNIAKFVEMFKEKFKEVFEMDLEVKEIENTQKVEQ